MSWKFNPWTKELDYSANVVGVYQPIDAALTNISGLVYVSPSFIKLTAEDTYAVRTIAQTLADLSVESGADVTDATNVAAAGAVMDGDFAAADEVMVGTGVGTHNQITLAASQFLGKKAAGAVTNLTAAEALTILGVTSGADVTANNAPQAHKDLHDPEDGSDKLDTAAGAEVSVVVAAGIGSSHSFARADHIHAINHGIADNHIVTIDGTTNQPVTTDYAKFTTLGLEGMNATQIKTDLGLVIGTNVQAYDAGLDSLAGLTYASDSFIKVTATDVYTIRTLAETKTDLGLDYNIIYVDAAAMVGCTTNGAASGTNEYVTNDIEWDYFAFDGGATEERAQFKLVMPEDWDRSTVLAKFIWSTATGSSAADTVEWGIKGQATSDDDAIDAAFGDAGEVISDTVIVENGTDLQITAQTPAITVGGTPALGDLITFEVYRNTDGTDDCAEDAWLFGIEIQYKKTNTVSVWS